MNNGRGVNLIHVSIRSGAMTSRYVVEALLAGQQT